MLVETVVSSSFERGFDERFLFANFNFQPANSVELALVCCHQHGTQRAGVCRNQKTVRPNCLANGFEFCANPAIFGVCGHIQCKHS